jgi:hypothetical protein
MFSRSDGPTALRADLVRALAFSSQQCELPLAQGGASEPAVAALAGVWNGRKGFVALVVYRIESQNVERYVFADPIENESGLDHAVEEGLAFAESFGFGMDAAEFTSLPVEQQEQRLRVWNKLRKPRQGIAAPAPPTAPAIAPPVFEHAGDIDPTATPTPVPGAEPLAGPAAAQPEPAAAAEPEPIAAADPPAGRAVLGRIELVRRGVEEARPDPLIRLLSYL